MLVIVGVLFAADPGPEWTLNETGTGYTRSIEIKLSRARNGNTTAYRLHTKHDTLIVHELDGSNGLKLECDPHFKVEVVKDAEGKATRIRMRTNFRSNHCAHVDLDANGTWDTMSDYRGEYPKSYINMDNTFVEVSHTRAGADFDVTRSVDNKTAYKFHEGRWHVWR